MKRTFVILAAVGLASFLGFPALLGGQTVSSHQRLTITVETPVGTVSGASVTAVRTVSDIKPLILPDARRGHSSVTSESVEV
jgi:hypothetical protein